MRKIILCLLMLSLLPLTGCATDEKEKKLTAIQDRKKQYEDLIAALQRKTIGKGTAPSTVRTLFGEPNDIFQSGFSESSIEIWTYMNVPVSKEEANDFKPVKLYFNDSKLVEWRI